MFRRSLLTIVALISTISTAVIAWPSPAAAQLTIPELHAELAAVVLVPSIVNHLILSLVGKLVPLLVGALVAPIMHAAQKLSLWYRSHVPAWLKPFLGAVLGMGAAQGFAAIGIQVPSAPLDQWSVNAFAGVIGGVLGYLMHWLQHSSSKSASPARSS